ncbi:hypothetical protein E2C01_032096 [Portunus trituberculatus]|uniref:Uncharacterized protein n=1 Tax=Portunus trituberculatus TaxID=210409 RepID=A0A5B7EZF0_PORTR|nr:hypothetical protein [Portunus trituberculatus]
MPIVPVGSIEECVGSTVQLLPISGTGNFVYSGAHIRVHITTQAHLGSNHLEPGYHGDILRYCMLGGGSGFFVNTRSGNDGSSLNHVDSSTH